jgi:hypothetical protein
MIKRKVCITWSFWVWKTTLVKSLNIETSFTDLERVLSIQWQDDWKQMYLITEQVREEYLNQWSYITDNSLITVLAYSYFKLKEDEYKRYYNRVKEFLEYYPYTKVFYIPIEYEIEDDNFRYTDKEFQKQINQKIIEILIDLKINFIIVTGTLEERKNIIFKNI